MSFLYIVCNTGAPETLERLARRRTAAGAKTRITRSQYLSNIQVNTIFAAVKDNILSKKEKKERNYDERSLIRMPTVAYDVQHAFGSSYFGCGFCFGYILGGLFLGFFHACLIKSATHNVKRVRSPEAVWMPTVSKIKIKGTYCLMSWEAVETAHNEVEFRTDRSASSLSRYQCCRLHSYNEPNLCGSENVTKSCRYTVTCSILQSHNYVSIPLFISCHTGETHYHQTS